MPPSTPAPWWWPLLLRQLGIPEATGKRVWRAIALAAVEDAALAGVVYRMTALQYQTGAPFLDGLRALFRAHGPRWWCETLDRLVQQNLLKRADARTVEEKILRLTGKTGQWK